MQFLIQLQLQVLAHRSMFFIHPVQELGDSSSEDLKFIVELRLDHIVMIFQLLQIDGSFHHFCKFTELVLGFLQGHEDNMILEGCQANLQFCEILLLNKSGVFKGFRVNAFKRNDEFGELLLC
jgi:hypothetical protein